MALVTNSGQVFTFNQVELDFFHKALNAGDLESLKDAQARIETNITTTTLGPVSGCVSVPGSYLLATERGITRMVLGGKDQEEEEEEGDDYADLENCVKLVVSKSDPVRTFLKGR